MQNPKKILIEQLDGKLKPFFEIKNIEVPERGWVYAIRTALNMTLQQLGHKLKITIQGAQDIEKRELSGSISIKSMQEVGRALDMKFVYGFVSNHHSLEKFIELKARELAEKMVVKKSNATTENIVMSADEVQQEIEGYMKEITMDIPKSLWD